MQGRKGNWPGPWLAAAAMLAIGLGAVLTADGATAQTVAEPTAPATEIGSTTDLPDSTRLAEAPALAGADSLQIDPLQSMLPWSPAPADTVVTAVAAAVATLDSVLAIHGRLEDAGAAVFARVRADHDSYWYEIVLGPFPGVADLDTALGEWPDQRGVHWLVETGAPEWREWERQSRGMVAPPQLLTGGPAAPPGNEVDANQGG